MALRMQTGMLGVFVRGMLGSLLVGALPATSAQTTQSIESASGYSDLSPCASKALSAIVQDQKRGCGGPSTYGCFCSQSSSHFNAIIPTVVTKRCSGNPDVQAFATSAQAVFADYCTMGAAVEERTTGGSSDSSATDQGTKSDENPSQSQSKSKPHITSIPHIDKLPDYSAIAGCAKTPLNDVVKDMKSGCGDASAESSFHCFCHQKSSSVNSLISTLVQSGCHDSVLVGQAQAVFSEYCDMGSTPLTEIPQVIATPTSMASTGAKPSTATATVTTTPGTKDSFKQSSTSSSSSSGGLAQSTIIAIGVCIPLVILAIAIVGFVLWRRRRASLSRRPLPPSPILPASEVYPPPGGPGGRGVILPPLDTRPTSTVYGSYKSSDDDVPDQVQIPTRLPPLTDQDEDAKVAPLVPPRSPLRTLSKKGGRPASMGEAAFADMGVTSEESQPRRFSGL